MLKAFDNYIKKDVLAWNAVRGRTFTCLDCDEEVTYKKGPIVTAHFAHRPGADCVMSESGGEGLRHEDMKVQMGKMFESKGFIIDYEVRFSGILRRADVVVRKGDVLFVIECQASPIGIQQLYDRTRDYMSINLPVLWVWDEPRVSYFLPFEYKIPAEVKYCWRNSPGGLYSLNQEGELRAYHFYFRTETLAEKVFVYPPLSVRFFDIKETGFKTVELGEGKFWKDRKSEDALFQSQYAEEWKKIEDARSVRIANGTATDFDLAIQKLHNQTKDYLDF